MVICKGLCMGEGIPKIAASIMAKDISELHSYIERMQDDDIDIVELRLDAFRESNSYESYHEIIQEVSEKIPEKPLLITYRSKEEGGFGELSLLEYESLIRSICLEKNVDMIDLEINKIPDSRELIKEIKANDKLVVASIHDYTDELSVSQIKEKMERLVLSSANVLKYVCMPRDEKDVMHLMEASIIEKEQHEDCVFVVHAMGKVGLISRVSAELIGSAIAFGAIEVRTKEDKKKLLAAAPGQLEVGQLKKCLEVMHEELDSRI